jgi:hypothetical protein
MFRFNKIIIREPTTCASLKLQYWCQLKYFIIELTPSEAHAVGSLMMILLNRNM